MFKRKNNLLPTTIANFFVTESRPESRYNLRRRQNNNLCFRSNLEVGKKSIQNVGEILWSELPPYLKDLESLKMFKKFYKSHLIGTNSWIMSSTSFLSSWYCSFKSNSQIILGWNCYFRWNMHTGVKDNHTRIRGWVVALSYS